MRARIVVAIAVALCACKKAEPPAGATTRDALWALTPDGANIGLVVSPAALSQLEAGAIEINKLFATAPELAPFKAKLDERMKQLLGTTTPSLTAAGLTAEKGMALFVADGNKVIVILPVADRDKFLATVNGQKGSDSDTVKGSTCKRVKNQYACASSPDLFDRLGKGSLVAELELARARGDIECAVSPPPGWPYRFGTVVQLSRGGAVMRVAVKGVPPEVRQILQNAKPRTDGAKTAAFAVLNFAPYLPRIRSMAPPVEIVPGLTVDMVFGSFEGPLSLTIDNGSGALDARMPLNDTAPAQKWIDQCDKLPGDAGVKVEVKNGVCHMTASELGLEVDVWIEGKTLRVGRKNTRPPATLLAVSPVAQELADSEWAVAAYGRGTGYGPSTIKLPLPADLGPEAWMPLRVLSMLNELGVGIRVDGEIVHAVVALRTSWSNPGDVVAKLLAIDLKSALIGEAGPQAKAIADASPGSPFATDYKAGMTGLAIPGMVIVAIATVAISSYEEYMKMQQHD
jgi:hypothetical protein